MRKAREAERARGQSDVRRDRIKYKAETPKAERTQKSESVGDTRLVSTTRFDAETGKRQDNGKKKEVVLKTTDRQDERKIASLDNHGARLPRRSGQDTPNAQAESGSGRERLKREDGCEDRGDFVDATGLGDARPR